MSTATGFGLNFIAEESNQENTFSNKSSNRVPASAQYKFVEELPDEVWDIARDYQANMEKYNPIIWAGGTSNNIKRLKKIIGSHFLAEDAVFYRRASLADLGKDLSNFPLDELIGKQYDFQGIMSASKNANMANSDVIFEISAPAGMPALDLTDVDYFQEVMFDSPQCHIKDIVAEGYNTTRIKISVTSPQTSNSIADTINPLDNIKIGQRTVFEIATLKKFLDLSSGDFSISQLGGIYRDVKKSVDSALYEVHHIPPQSVFADDFENLPAIAVLKEDHAKTSSYRGKMNKSYQSYLPGETAAQHKQSVKDLIDQGNLAEAIRNEIYEIREVFGTKYDGAIMQYLDAMSEYINQNGMPEVKK